MPSTVIAFALYHEKLKALDVGYRNGRVYRYLDVPQAEYAAYQGSFSKGQFLNDVIKKNYEFERLS